MDEYSKQTVEYIEKLNERYMNVNLFDLLVDKLLELALGDVLCFMESLGSRDRDVIALEREYTALREAADALASVAKEYLYYTPQIVIRHDKLCNPDNETGCTCGGYKSRDKMRNAIAHYQDVRGE